MDEGKKAFLAESSELLEDMESSLLLVEASEGDDREALNSVFRAIHTIKGSAGVVGIDNVEKFAHKVESVLDSMRQGILKPTAENIGLMLECRDHISTLISVAVGQQQAMSYTATEEVRLTEALDALLGPRDEAEIDLEESAHEEEDEGTGFRVATDNWHISLRFSPDVLRNGMDPLSFISYLGGLGTIAHIYTITDTLPTLMDMDPETCYLGFEIDLDTRADKAAIEDVFEFVREDCTIHILPPKSRISKYVNLIGSLPEDRYRLGEILVQGGAVTERELAHALEIQKNDTDKNIGDILVDEGIIHKPVLDAAVQKQQGQPVGRAIETSSIRVDTEKLDALVNIVGEMVITGASVQQEAAQIKNARLLQAVSSMARLIESLRDSAMRVRMMPLHDTFGRFHRTVRDICHESGKDIALEVEGAETELDRTLIEKIKDPLMHLVRNAADHGIEAQQERTAAGKPARGTITLRAYQETGDIIIEVQDDGKGLSKKKIAAKALDRELIDKEHAASLSEREILQLIFMPGFSTAEEITSISGRGVGMDVVRRNIEALHGSVDIQSHEGRGTTVKVRLPLTLAIIDGFLVSVGDSHFVVPMDMVVECIELTAKLKSEAHGRDHVNLRGHVLPYISLRSIFSTNGTDAGSRLEHVLVVQHSGMKTGLLVDRLHGEVQAVVKSLGKVYKGVKGLSGATIMGDGTVALILDVPALVKKALDIQKH